MCELTKKSLICVLVLLFVFLCIDFLFVLAFPIIYISLSETGNVDDDKLIILGFIMGSLVFGIIGILVGTIFTVVIKESRVI